MLDPRRDWFVSHQKHHLRSAEHGIPCGANQLLGCLNQANGDSAHLMHLVTECTVQADSLQMG